MIQHQTDFPELFRLDFEKRAEEELFNINKDPYCLHDISRDKKMQKVRIKLKSVLEKVLISQSDPRMTDHGDIFDSYPRFGLMRPFEGFKERGKYNEKYMNKN
ncbi:MAG: hypothetical protein IPK94_01670 [Saprospiraceae bacterium]|nr:hypothetical protein [Saprospiraceae bacterium]